MQATAHHDFSKSSLSISQSLGFAPELTSQQAGWNRLAIFGWRGSCSEVQLERFNEPVIIFYVAGVPSISVSAESFPKQYLHPGQITILPPGTAARFDIKGRLASRSIHLDSTSLTGPLGIDQVDVDCFRFVSGVRDDMVASVVQTLEHHLQSPSQIGGLFADTISDALALHVLSAYGRRPVETNAPVGLPQHVLTRVLERLHASISDGVSLQQLADEAGLSRAHLASAFKRSMGVPPHRYLTQIRLQEARRYLLSTKLPIVDIALKCGFCSQPHFTREFCRAFGRPPLRFRNEHGHLRHFTFLCEG